MSEQKKDKPQAKLSRRDFLKKGTGLAAAAGVGITGAATLLPGAKAAPPPPPITGSGTSGRIAKFTGSMSIGNSLMADTGSSINPDLDNARTLGDVSSRWNSVRTLAVESGASDLTLNPNLSIRPVTDRTKDLGFFSTTDTTQNAWRNVFGHLPIFLGELWVPLDIVPNWITKLSTGTTAASGGGRVGALSCSVTNSEIIKIPTPGPGIFGNFEFSKDLLIVVKIELDVGSATTAPDTQAGILGITDNITGDLNPSTDHSVHIAGIVNPDGTVNLQAISYNADPASVNQINLATGNGGVGGIAVIAKIGARLHAWWNGSYMGSILTGAGAPVSGQGFVRFSARSFNGNPTTLWSFHSLYVYNAA